jgi:transketolase
MKMELYPTMRGYFAYYLHRYMAANKRVWLVTGDFGYKMWDAVQEDYPDRYINTGASESTMMGIAVGLGLQGKIPIVYTATPFLLYRPFETIRNYIDHEKIPVILIGSGRNRDYLHDGFSHWAEEDKQVMRTFLNISSVWPKAKEEIPALLTKILKGNRPWYVNLSKTI